MNIKNSLSVYPSYKTIQQQVQQKYIHQYQQKIQTLKHHLNNLEKSHHFHEDHQRIKASILNLSTENPHYNSHSQDKIKIHQKKKPSLLSNNQGESLNYYIQDDGEEQSNYETYLKFKKKALERDLQQEQFSKVQLNSHDKKKKQQEEQFFFRKLYDSEPHKQTLKRKKQSSNQNLQKKNRNHGFNYKQAKQNAESFVNKIQKDNFKVSEKQQKNASLRRKGIESQLEIFQKNRKYLKENYFQILKKLQGTNIVKWRVLNNDREKSH